MTSSSSVSHSSTNRLHALKFGHTIDFGDVPVGAQPESSSSSGTVTKKGMGGTFHGAQPPRCQVEGCEEDLSDAKAYYSRHKVCGFHSKSPQVIVAGLEQRFCQQCSRFHQLTEFDQEKRSCRRKLAGHNESRRKPQPSSLLISPYARFSPAVFDNRGRVGGFLMEFAAYRKPTLWNEFPAAASMEQIPGNQSSTPPWQGSGPRNRLGECFAGVAETSCALSLLSNQTWRLRNAPPALGVNNLCFAASSHGSPIHHQFSIASGSFKGIEPDNCLLHEVVPDLAANQISLSNSELPGALVTPQSEAYESSQLMHWSL